LLSTSFLTNAQEVEVTLSGNTTAQGFSVLDNSSNNLFRVRGDGSVGFGTATPLGIFNILGDTISSGDGKGINIYAQATDGPNGDGGDINITSGNALENGGISGDINIKTAGFNGYSIIENTGDINIECGFGEATGGDVNLIAGSNVAAGGGYIKIFGGNFEGVTNVGGIIEIKSGTNIDDGPAGDIKILTGRGGDLGSGGPAGNISLTCGRTEYQDGASIDLTAGYSNDAKGGDVNIAAGESNSSSANGGDVNITGGNSTLMDGGDIILTPGPGGDTDGLVIVNGSGTYSGTWTQSSDKRYKKNIQPLHNTIEAIKKLNGVRYEYNTELFPEKNFESGKHIGLIAQDVEKVFPELVKTDSEGFKSVAYQNIVAVLIEAIKEQQHKIERLERMIYGEVEFVDN
ncbi:MAG: tail fiber domain-containing protein, partial [Deltaproteobacteria bacterium]|nr:tail fiber domain-containing protein [Deltaproteobacteria bacterium]